MQVEFIGKTVCESEIATVRLTRPDGFDFRPGQWIRLTLETAEGPETKTFSLASAPADSLLELAMRLSGTPFKNAVAALSPGDRVTIKGPGGRLRPAEGASRVAFLVGGVGVTPVRSMLRHAHQNGERFEDAVIFFGDRDPDCTPYRAELESYSDVGVRVVPVYEHAPVEQHVDRGFITADIVREHLEQPESYAFLVSGPPIMVAAMSRVMDDLGIPEDMRAIESFGPVTVTI